MVSLLGLRYSDLDHSSHHCQQLDPNVTALIKSDNPQIFNYLSATEVLSEILAHTHEKAKFRLIIFLLKAIPVDDFGPISVTIYLYLLAIQSRHYLPIFGRFLDEHPKHRQEFFKYLEIAVVDPSTESLHQWFLQKLLKENGS